MSTQPKKKSRPSRRKEERWKKREWKEKQEVETKQNYQLTIKPYNNIILDTKHCCIREYDFASDLHKPLWESIPSTLKTLPTNLFLQTPISLQCHNLCEKETPPPGYNQLLCLGLNYCDETLHSNPNLKQMIDKLKKSIHLKHWVDKYGANNNNKGCIPSVFIPTTWRPPEASTETEEAIKNFTSNIKYSGRKQNLPKVQPHQASI